MLPGLLLGAIDTEALEGAPEASKSLSEILPDTEREKASSSQFLLHKYAFFFFFFGELSGVRMSALGRRLDYQVTK